MTQIIDWDDENFFEASNDEEDKVKIVVKFQNSQGKNDSRGP